MLKPLAVGMALTIALNLFNPAIFADSSTIPVQEKKPVAVKSIKAAPIFKTMITKSDSEKKTLEAKIKTISEYYMTITDNDKKEYLVFLGQFLDAKGFKDLTLKEGMDITLNGFELKTENGVNITFSEAQTQNIATKADDKVNNLQGPIDIQKAMEEGKIKLVESKESEDGSVKIYKLEDGINGQIKEGTITIATKFKGIGEAYNAPKIDENTNLFHAESITCNGKTINQVIPEIFKKSE